MGKTYWPMVSHKSHGGSIKNSKVPSVASLTVLGKWGELKSWMHEQPAKNGLLRHPVSPKGALWKC